VRAFVVIWFFLLAAAAPAAQIDPTGRSGEPPTLPKDFQPELPKPGTLLPPVPILPKAEPIPGLRVVVREIRVTGSTVFPPEQLAKVTEPYLDRELTSEDLEALRVALTLLYVNNGYVTSGAILPDQTVTAGVVTYEIIEGRLAEVEVEGNRWFRSSYLQKRFKLDAGPPLNVNALQRRLQFLLEDQRFQRLNADLRPGTARGEATLDVRVEERTPYRLYLEYNNYQSPAVGQNRGLVTFEHQNLTGNGDVLMAQYGGSYGLKPLLDFKYTLPVSAYDTAVSYEYRRNILNVIRPPFQVLNIKSQSDVYTATLRQPIYRTLNTNIALELIGERLSDKNDLLGHPFSLQPGANNGRAVDTAIRTVQEFVYRTQNQVLAARSRFSFGIDALDATINHDGRPDGIFFAWLGEFQWVRRFDFLNSYAIFRSAFQHSDSPLLSMEQYSIGGRYSVRGYEENTLLRDRAINTSFEMRLPIIQNAFYFDYFELAQFFDFGRGWNTNRPTLGPQDLSSVGVGLRLGMTIPATVPLRPQFEVYWGHQLRKVESRGSGLQAHGVHMQFVLAVF
jgi:hemolysin activation/secretion protein